MSERIEKDFLSDIKEAMRRTNSYTENLSYEEFLEDIKTQDAVIRNIEIIGEAAKHIRRIKENISGNSMERYGRHKG